MVDQMDRICITGIRSYGYVGALPEEQVLGQWFEVAVTLWLDLTLPGHSDRLEDTLDYRTVIDKVQQLVQTARFKLIECLAAAIAENLLDDQPVAQVQVRLTKLAAPIPNFGGQVTVELTRRRASDFFS
ncbi:MAG TPA: dihydroneopterin aldolase [Candidatus Caenarcaniphilales bacterium]